MQVYKIRVAMAELPWCCTRDYKHNSNCWEMPMPAHNQSYNKWLRWLHTICLNPS